MRHLIVIASLLFTLTACADAKFAGQQAADDIRDNIHTTTDRVEKWWNTPPPQSGPSHAVKSSYCYNVMQDIVCYRQPMPGWEHRLAGYQGTGAEPPQPATTKPLPTYPKEAALDTEARIAASKPVFKEMPKEEKEEEKTSEGDVPAAADTAHETLPDPALAPQL